MVYGYCRISRKEQNIERQVRNILATYPDAIIINEAYTGTTTDRPEFNKLINNLEDNSIIVFDSVSRMARNAIEGYELYFSLYEKGIHLVFLKEPHINSEVFKQSIQNTIPMTGSAVDKILEGINEYMKELAKEQIRIAFEQAQKEVDDLHDRTKEGIETARLAGKQIGQKKGAKLNIKKEAPAKKLIKKYSKDFNGNLTDVDAIKIIGISRNTYYKYKRELLEEAENNTEVLKGQTEQIDIINK